MNADTFREWARLKHRRSDTLLEDAMIAATALGASADGRDPQRARF